MTAAWRRVLVAAVLFSAAEVVLILNLPGLLGL